MAIASALDANIDNNVFFNILVFNLIFQDGREILKMSSRITRFGCFSVRLM